MEQEHTKAPKGGEAGAAHGDWVLEVVHAVVVGDQVERTERRELGHVLAMGQWNGTVMVKEGSVGGSRTGRW